MAHADRELGRRRDRERSARRLRERREAGRCSRCGKRPPVEGGATCEPCRLARRAAEKGRYFARRAAGQCVRCGEPAMGGGSRCAPCAVTEAERRSAERKNAATRRRYSRRRARRECTDCGAPANGAARCPACARRSRERSPEVRGMPVHPPRFAVFLRDSDECLGVFDDEMEVAAFLAFGKLDRDRVEVVADRPWLATLAAWE